MPDQPNRERDIFEAALELTSPEARSGYLLGVCGDDAQLRARLEALLLAHDQAGGFLSEREPKSPGGAPGKTVSIGTSIFPVTEKPGDRVGRYKLREKIGEGGCGVVYVAEQEEPVRRRVALKVIKLGMDTKQVIARFEAERQALAMMDHPNIAKVLDAGATETGRPYFVMELVRGIKITDYCDQNKLPTRQRLDLFIKVCQAIQHAHQKGIIHRDIKPSNILVTLHDGVPVPKIIDFGISKATEGRLTDLTVYTELHQFIGTPAYMSPEQAEMSGLDIDTRTDIYSLGVLLYELLTGGTPFDAKELLKSGLDAMRKTIREIEPQRPSTKLSTMLDADLTAVAQRHGAESPKLVHLVRGDLDWIVMKSLEKDRTRRYETANGLAMDINRHLSNEPIVARPPSSLYRFQKMIRRNKVAFAAAAAVAAAVLLGLGFSSWEAIRATKSEHNERSARVAAEESRVRESRQRALADENARKTAISEQSARSLLYAADMRLADQAWKEGNLGRMASLLDAHRPKPGETNEQGFEYYYLQNLAKGEQDQVLYHPANAILDRTVSLNEIKISPDGRWLASHTHTEVLLWDLTARTPVPPFSIRVTNRGFDPSIPEFDWNISFSYDSQYLSIPTDAGLQLFHITTRQTRTLSTERTSMAAFSPVTNLIVFTAGEGLGTTRVWDYLSNKEVRALGGQVTAAWSPDGSRLLTGRWSSALESWDTTSWTVLRTYRFNSYVSDAVISPDGKLVAAADWQGVVHLIGAADGREIGTVVSGDVRATALAFSPDGNVLVTGSGDQAIRIWDVATHRLVRQFRGHKGKVVGCVFTPDGKQLASTATDGDVMLWNLNSSYGDSQIPNDLSRFDRNLINFSPDGKWLSLQLTGDSLAVTDSRRFRASASTPGEIVGFSPDASQFVTLVSGNIPELQIWKTGTRTKRAGIYLDRPVTTWMSQLSPDGTVVAVNTGKFDNYLTSGIELFEASTGKAILTIDGLSPLAPASCFLPDGRTMAYADRTRIKFWDLSSHANIRVLECTAEVYSFAMSLDGKTLAAGQADNLISLWDLKSATRIGTLAGHQARVFALAFSPDGRTLASGGEDRTIKLWHLATQRELVSIPREKSTYGLVFSPDNQMLVSGEFGAYQIWPAPQEAAVAALRSPSASVELPTNSVWRLPDGPDRSSPQMVAEQDLCFSNLMKIHAAIMAYEKDNQKMPDWLSDLVPKYLEDTNCLICPVCARTGEKPNLRGLDDPKLTSSYFYEFDAHLNPWTDVIGVASPGDTMKAWKEKQLTRYGPIVPVIRCPMHPQFLSVTYAGEQRQDQQQRWETDFELKLQLEHITGTNASWFNGTAWHLATAENGSERSPAQAVKLARRAVVLGPKAGTFRNTLGVALYRNGEFQEAITALEKSVQLGSTKYGKGGTGHDFFFLAMAHHQLGDDEAAKRYYLQAIQWMQLQQQPAWELRSFQIEAEETLGPSITGEVGNKIRMPSLVK